MTFVFRVCSSFFSRPALRLMLPCLVPLLFCAAPGRILGQAGTLDANFVPTTNGNVTTIALQGDKIVIGGDFTNVNGQSARRIARLTADGALDPTFTPGSAADDKINSVVIKADGGIVIGGDFNSYNGTTCVHVALLRSNGTLDPAFVPPNPGPNGSVYTVGVQPDDFILVCGPFSKFNSTTPNGIVRLTDKGVLDSSFKPGTGANNTVFTFFRDNGGNIVIGGAFTKFNGITRNYCARLSPTGAVDPNFDPSLTVQNGFNVSSVLVQPNGSVILGGFFGGINGTTGDKVFSLARFNGNGTLDYGFDPYSGSNGTVFGLALQPDNAIVLGGYFNVVRDQTRNGVARLYSNGDLDPSFDPGAGTNGATLAVAVQADGKIVIGGVFTSVGNVARSHIARLNSYPPVITSATAASVTATQFFSYQIAASFNPASYGAANLPAGLSVDPATGLISGTPTIVGTYSVALGATNANGTGSATLTLRVLPAIPVITNGAPPAGQVGAAYSFPVSATNSPTSFTASGLPRGLAIDATAGQISGTPTQAGTFTVGLSATNTYGTGSKTVSLTILPGVPVITSAASASGQAGKAFAYQITATNNPTSFSVQGLNDKLTVDATGLISGTPPATESVSLTLNATNAGGTGTATLSLTITSGASSVPVITSDASVSGQVDLPFSYQIAATNSPASYNASGLPDGLTVDTQGNISGTPTTQGSYYPSLSATNSSGTGTATLTLSVSAAPENIYGFNFASPPAGSQFVGGPLPDGTQGTVPIYVQVLYRPGTLSGVQLFADDLTTGTSAGLGQFTASITTFRWQPPAPAATTKPDAYMLRAVATDTTGAAKTFTLPISVVSPPSANPVSTIQLMPDVSGKTFVAGSDVALVPVEGGTADSPIVSVTGQDTFGNPKGLSKAPLTTYGTHHIFPPFHYQPVKSSTGTATVTVTYMNGCSVPSMAVYLSSSDSHSALKCAITTPAAGADGAATVPAGKPLTVSVDSANASSVEYYLDGLPAGTSTSAPFSYTLPASALSAGQHVLIAIATDAMSISLEAAPVTLTAQEPPVITSATSASATAGKSFSYQIAATNNPTKYGASGLPSGLTIDQATGKISGTPRTSGTSTVTIAAFNATGSGLARLALTVKEAVPSITSARTASAQVGTAFSYQVTATGNPTTYQISSLAAGLSFDTTTGKLSGTPTKAGSYRPLLSATNGSGTGSANVDLTVKPAKPAITSPLNPPARQGVAFSYQITATNSPTGYATSTVPPGLVFDTAKGKFTGTPTRAGTYKPLVSATNAGGTGSENLDLIVKAPAN